MADKDNLNTLRDMIAAALARNPSSGPPPALLPGNLSELFGPGLPPPLPPVIRSRWFKNETLRIDGYRFERCRFDSCNLVTEMASFAFKDSVIGPDCGLYFTGPALKVARLLMHTLEVKGRIVRVAGEEALFAHVNPDGTFTLE